MKVVSFGFLYTVRAPLIATTKVAHNKHLDNDNDNDDDVRVSLSHENSNC